MQRARMIASGRVQRVGFRQFVRRIGEDCGLSGYVRNLPDGTVEIVAEGEEKGMENFRKRALVRVPAGISVEGIEILAREKIGKRAYASFSVAF